MSSLDQEMTRELTAWEQHLLESQEVLEVRGKVIIAVIQLLKSNMNS